MGKIKNNIVTKGFSGKFGDELVFRQVDKKTIFAKRTLVTTAPTPMQEQVRNTFAEAANYASAAIDNPIALEDYKAMAKAQGLKTAYVAAVTDFLTYPQIVSLFAGSYKGAIADVINIKPKFALKIVSIDVSILLPGGTVLESGKAVVNQLKWKYTTTKANVQLQGSKIVLKAYDRLGKVSNFEYVI